MKFTYIPLFLSLAENAVNCDSSTTITGSLILYKDNVCENKDQLSVGTADLALNKKVFLKDSGVAFPIQSLKWQYPGPFKLSFYDGVAEQPYATVLGPEKATFVSSLCSGFKTNGLGGSSLNVTILDTSRVKSDSPIFVSPESYFIVESSSPSSAPSLDPSSAPSAPSSEPSLTSSSSASFSASLASSLSTFLSSLFQ